MRQCNGISDQIAHRAAQRKWYLHIAHHPTHSSRKWGGGEVQPYYIITRSINPARSQKYRLISTGIGKYSTQNPRQTAHCMIPSEIFPSASGRHMLPSDNHFQNCAKICNSSVLLQSSPTLRTSDQTRESPTPAAHLSATYKQCMMTPTRVLHLWRSITVSHLLIPITLDNS